MHQRGNANAGISLNQQNHTLRNGEIPRFLARCLQWQCARNATDLPRKCKTAMNAPAGHGPQRNTHGETHGSKYQADDISAAFQRFRGITHKDTVTKQITTIKRTLIRQSYETIHAHSRIARTSSETRFSRWQWGNCSHLGSAESLQAKPDSQPMGRFP